MYLSIIYALTDDDFPVKPHPPPDPPFVSKQVLRFEIDSILTAIFALPSFSANTVCLDLFLLFL